MKFIMKSFPTFSIVVLFVLVSGIMITPSAFAEMTANVSAPAGSGAPGCEETNACYIPYEVTIDVGGEVTWSNDDSAAHTVTSGGAAAGGPNGIFDSSLWMAGTTFSHKFEEAGTYDYFCIVHPWMEGIVVVQEAAAEEVMEEVMEEAEEVMEEAEEVMEEAVVVAEEVMEEAEVVAEEVMEEAEVVAEEVMEEAEVVAEEVMEEAGGGCLIATAAYGTELAPQVQLLREIRDNTVMSTESGKSFMTGFNTFYYSFSPTIADMERANPMFQEAVRTFITPMISTLSIMTLAEDGNDAEVLGLGISVIALNLGMYIAAPAAVAFAISKRLKSF